MLDIDDDVLAAAKDLARRERTTTGELVSDVMREALHMRSHPAPADRPRRASHVHGFDPIPAGGGRRHRRTGQRASRGGGDLSLLALAVAHGARMVTLDKSVPLSAVPGASEDSLVAI